MPRVIGVTVYRFDELEPEVRAKVLDRHRYDYLQGHSWWEHTYEDAKRMGKILGLDIDAIHFDDYDAGFNSSYTFNPGAVAQIGASAPQDEELHRLAIELTGLNMLCFIEHGAAISATTTERSCRTSVEAWAVVDDTGLARELEGPNTAAFFKLMRDFSDWIHKQLKSEEKYLTSDECIKERLMGEEFDEDGAII